MPFYIVHVSGPAAMARFLVEAEDEQPTERRGIRESRGLDRAGW